VSLERQFARVPLGLESTHTGFRGAVVGQSGPQTPPFERPAGPDVDVGKPQPSFARLCMTLSYSICLEATTGVHTVLYTHPQEDTCEELITTSSLRLCLSTYSTHGVEQEGISSFVFAQLRSVITTSQGR
jgi:hypothetical protein